MGIWESPGESSVQTYAGQTAVLLDELLHQGGGLHVPELYLKILGGRFHIYITVHMLHINMIIHDIAVSTDIGIYIYKYMSIDRQTDR